MAGEYTASVVLEGIAKFVSLYAPRLAARRHTSARPAAAQAVEAQVHPRPPSFCTGCPERPIFTAMKLVERELGAHHMSCDIGCHLFSILPPFNIGATTMGYGLCGWARAPAGSLSTRPKAGRTESRPGTSAPSASWAMADSGTTA